MSRSLTDFWWRCFYRCKHEKSETEMKSLLFKGELSEEEFDKLKSSTRNYFNTKTKGKNYV